MASWDVQIEGLDDLRSTLAASIEQMRRGTEAGLYQSALVQMAQSQKIVPIGGPPQSPHDVAPGTLRDSGIVLLPEWEGDTCVVVLGYGGAASAYAWRQHEDLTYSHKPGQQAKYLETPMSLDAPNVTRRIRDAIQLEQRR